MSISRAQFLKSVGASVLGLSVGSGLGRVAECALDAYHRGSPTAPGSVFSAGNRFGRRIALTFEDGPTPVVTSAILAELKKRQVKATFFVLGQRVAAEADLLRQIRDEGHEIGSHGFSHTHFFMLPQASMVQELTRTQEIVSATIGHLPAWFRTPGTLLSHDDRVLVQDQGLGLAGWSVDSQDLVQPDPKRIVQSILNGTRNGSVIQCHDLHPRTVACLGEALDELTARGFEFVTVSKLSAHA